MLKVVRSLYFFIGLILPEALWTLDINKYQEYFLGVSRPIANNNTTFVIVLKSGSSNLMEPSGPFQTYIGTDLPLFANCIIYLW